MAGMVQWFLNCTQIGATKTEHEGAEIQQGLLDVEDFQLIFVLKVVTNIFRYP